MEKVSNGFEMFLQETNGIGVEFMKAVIKLSDQSSIDKKYHELAYISVLVTARMLNGLPYHIEQAKKLGATIDEIRSAVLIPMPVVGIQVVEALPFVK